MPKAKVMVPQDIEFDSIRVKVPVRYGDEDIPNDFPFRKGDMWEVVIDISDNGTAKIREWPALAFEMCMKVCDEGVYQLLRGKEVVATREDDYVPRCFPDGYGDYIEFDIAADGTITNWKKSPDYAQLFPE
jgi:hypothetical protein